MTSTRSGLQMIDGVTLTATLMAPRLFGHSPSWRSARWKAKRVSGSICPVISATSMKISGGTLPASGRFQRISASHAHHLELRQRQLRLVVQDEVAMLERVRELGLEVPAGRELLRLAIRVDDGRGLRFPGLEQRDLGALHERLGRARVRRDTWRCRREAQVRMMAARRDGLGAGAQDLVGGKQRVAFIPQVGEHEDELAVAEARKVVAGPHDLRDAIPELVQHAPGVYLAGARGQALELVHVDDEHGDAVELRLARGEPRMDRLQAVGIGTAPAGDACGAVIMASIEVALRHQSARPVSGQANAFRGRILVRKTVTNCARRERDAERKNMTNGRFSGRKTPGFRT